jgi:hypothetical protein
MYDGVAVERGRLECRVLESQPPHGDARMMAPLASTDPLPFFHFSGFARGGC